MDVDGAEGPVFITGLDRSGKTRLRLLLGTHPDLHLVRHTALWTREGATEKINARALGIRSRRVEFGPRGTKEESAKIRTFGWDLENPDFGQLLFRGLVFDKNGDLFEEFGKFRFQKFQGGVESFLKFDVLAAHPGNFNREL